MVRRKGLPINIEITSADYETALAYADGMKRFIESTGIEGIERLKLDVEKSKPEMPITIDRDKARRYGLSTQQIGFGLRSALFGREVSRYKDGEDDYPINLRFADAYRNNADALMNQKVIFRSQLRRPNQGGAHLRCGHRRSVHDLQRHQAERTWTAR